MNESNNHTSRKQFSTATLRRVLSICYAFPPTGGGGVQRAVKFAKYLPDFGWRPTILTVANPSVPVQDDDFAADLDPKMEIVRARTLEPGYGIKKQIADTGSARGGVARFVRSKLRRLSMRLLQPDPQVLWNPQAYRFAVRTLRATPYDAILVTGPPFSSFLLGRKLKRRFGVPLILDFRDEWMLACRYLDNHQQRDSDLRRQQAMMHRSLQAADAVIATTQASAAELQRCCREIQSDAHVSCIYNGFDPDDIAGISQSQSQSKRLRIVYTGTLWSLTDIGPFARALESLKQISHNHCADIQLSVAGRQTPAQDAILKRLDESGFDVDRPGYLAHKQSLQLASRADVLLLLLSDQPGAERVVPAKLFEYLALGRTILAIVPSGETCDLMRDQPNCHVFHPNETDKIAHWLATRMDGSSLAPPALNSGAERALDPNIRFSRSNLTSELADVLSHSAPMEAAGREPTG